MGGKLEEIHRLRAAAAAAVKEGDVRKAQLCYARAVVAMEKMVKEHPSFKEEYIRLLDCQAGHYADSRQFDQVYRIGKAMVLCDRLNGLGYLRTAVALAGKREPARAIKVVYKGMQMCSNPEIRKKLRITLEELENLLKKNKSPKRVNFGAVFPSEVIVMIVSKLDFRSLVNLACVSKAWRAFLTSTSELWRSIDLSELKFSNKAKIDDITKIYASRAGRNLQELTCRDSPSIVPYIRYLRKLRLLCDYYAPQCRRPVLNVLLADAFENLRFLSVTGLSLHEVNQLCRNLPDLQGLSARKIVIANSHSGEHMIIPKCRQLRKVDLQIRYQIGIEIFVDLEGLAHLKELCLINCLARGLKETDLPTRRLSLEYPASSSGRVRHLPPTLKELELSSVHLLDESVAIPSDLKSVSLGIDFHRPATDKINALLLKSSKTLKSLCIKNFMPQEIALPDDLESLDLSNIDTLMDAHLKPIHKLTKLAHLNLDHTRISGAAIVDLVHHLSESLKTLSVRDCNRISRETCEWVHSRGIDINFGWFSGYN